MLGRTDYQTPSVQDPDALSDIWVSTCEPGTSVWVESRKSYYTLDLSSRPKPWPDGEEQRWLDVVFEIAALPSTHEAVVGIETTDTPTADEWRLEGPEQAPLTYRRKRFAPSGTVQTAWGRVHLADVPRSTRGSS